MNATKTKCRILSVGLIWTTAKETVIGRSPDAGSSADLQISGYLAKTKDVSFENMKRAIIYGSAMASFTVEKFGTEKLIGLSQADVEERVQEFIDLVQFDIALV